MFKRKGKVDKWKLPENVLVLFKRAILKLPFDLTEKQIDGLIKAAERITLDTTERLVVKGARSPGLFIAVSGRVEAVTSTGRVALRVIKQGDFFGDISSFFGVPCPVSIRAYEGAEIILVKSQSLSHVLREKPKISLFQWFIKRKYIDTSRLFQEHSLSKELAYQSLQETPIFHGWSSDSLHYIVEQTLPEILVLFPTGSYISRQGDHACEVFILVHGAARLTSNKKELVTVSAGKTSFCMGEEAFFNNLKRNFNIIAETPCLVLTVNKEHLNHLFYSDIPCEEEQALHKSLSNHWKDVQDRQEKIVYSKYSGQLELEVISIVGKFRWWDFSIYHAVVIFIQAHFLFLITLNIFFLFSHSNIFDCLSFYNLQLLWQSLHQRGLQIPFLAGFFHALFLSMKAMEVEVGKEILSSDELYDTIVVLLKGCAELFSGNQSAGNIQSVGLYLPSGDVPNGSWIKATEASLIIKIPSSAVHKAQDQFPDIKVLPQPD